MKYRDGVLDTDSNYQLPDHLRLVCTVVLSGSPAKSGPMTLTSENRFPLFFVC